MPTRTRRSCARSSAVSGATRGSSSGSRRGAPRGRAREEDFFEREEGVSGSILGEILAAKRRRIAAGEFTAETARARSRVGAGLFAASPDGASFTAALSSSSNSFSKQNLLLSFLSEIKHRSPSAGLILPDASSRIESVACAYRRGGASALSVVCLLYTSPSPRD